MMSRMEFFQSAIDYFLHLDKHLGDLVQEYGLWTYTILFLIIFCETGLVVTPFLPGDSLLFAAGAIAGTGALNVGALILLLILAAALGDSANYWIGSTVGTRMFKEDARILKLDYLRRTEVFFERYGGKTIVIARFVPIVRTYAPFVAGAARMRYTRFLTYNVVGAMAWIILFVLGGYLFGGISFVQDNFSLVIVVVILLSLLPPLIEFLKTRKQRRRMHKIERGDVEDVPMDDASEA
jgi:membrane-associated protein